MSKMKKTNVLREQISANSQNLDIKVKSLCITQRGRKYYYPPTIPKERSNLTKKICIVTCIILSTVDYYTNKLAFWTFVVYYLCGFLGNVGLHLLYRILLIFEEFKHIKSRYEDNYLTIFKDAFHFPATAIAASLLAFLGISFLGFGDVFPITNPISLFLFACTIFLLGTVFELNSSPLNSSLQISRIDGLDYGSGMAYSFFNGYLKLIMQKTGTEDTDLKELMEIYEGQHGVKFEVYKLFVLIPISLRCFVSLKNDFSVSVDESHSLPEKQITVAGVQNRVYKNAVYKISLGTTKKYVCAEYATPLKTFNDVVNSSGSHSVYYKKHKNEISLQFYLTLRKILKSTKLDELCELIFFEDSYEDDEGNTRYHDVGKLLLRRLKDMQKNQREKTD